jgi:hypothetical protein
MEFGFLSQIAKTTIRVVMVYVVIIRPLDVLCVMTEVLNVAVEKTHVLAVALVRQVLAV